MQSPQRIDGQGLGIAAQHGGYGGSGTRAGDCTRSDESEPPKRNDLSGDKRTKLDAGCCGVWDSGGLTVRL